MNGRRFRGRKGISLIVMLLSVLIVLSNFTPLLAQERFDVTEAEASEDQDNIGNEQESAPQDAQDEAIESNEESEPTEDAGENTGESDDGEGDVVTPGDNQNEGENPGDDAADPAEEESSADDKGDKKDNSDSKPANDSDKEGSRETEPGDVTDEEEQNYEEEVTLIDRNSLADLERQALIRLASTYDYDTLDELDAVASTTSISSILKTLENMTSGTIKLAEAEPDPNAPKEFNINKDLEKEAKDRQVTLVTEEMNRREHTYIIIGGQKLDLKNDGLKNLADGTTIANNSRVKLSLVFQIKGGNVREQDYITYDLPDNLLWESKSGAIYDRSDPTKVVGTYVIADNKITVRYTADFLKDNGMIDTRVNVEGRAIADEDKEGGKYNYEFDGIGEIKDVEISTEAQLQVEKAVQSDKLIINNDEQNPENTTIDVYYLVEIDVAGDDGGKMTDIEITDTIANVTGSDNAQLGAKFLPETFTFGTEFSNDEYRDKIKDLNVTNDTFSFKVDEWTKEDGKLYVTYAVRIKPILKAYNNDNKGDNTEIVLSNNLKSTTSKGPGPSAEDDFVYKNGMVDKGAAPVADESYMADWTATFNDYSPIAGADLGMALIQDTLKQDDGTGSMVLKQDIEPIDESAMVTGQYTPSNWNLENFSIMVYEGSEGRYLSGHEATTEDFAKMTDASGNPTITDKQSFAEAFIVNGGVKVPTSNKYVIKYRTRLFPSLEPEAGDLSEVNLENSASNGPDILPAGGSVTSGIGVGPAKPKLTKGYKAVDGAPGQAQWEVTAEIKDEKVQIRDNLIYDYISKGHEIITSSPIEFYIDDEKVGEIAWNNTAVVTKRSDAYVDNGDTKTTTPVDVDGKSVDQYNSAFQENFKFDIVAALKAVGKSSEVIDSVKLTTTETQEGLKKHKYKIVYKTKLSLDSFDKAEVSGTSFTYKNNAFIVLPDKTIDEKSASTTRNLISKYNLDDYPVLYQKATGKSLDDLAFQEIPWYMTAMVFEDGLVLTDSYRKQYDADGDMTFVDGSLIVYQTTKDIDKIRDTSSTFNWSTDAKVVPDSQYTFEKTKFDNGKESGFKLSFKNGALDLVENNRVIVFFVTRGGDDYDNNKSLSYVNNVTPNYAAENNPVATDRTARAYKILNKTGEPDNPDDPAYIRYTVDINNSAMDLASGDTLELTDELKQYVYYVAGSMKFYEMDKDGNIVAEHKNGEDGYSVDAHEQATLKITVPDETYVRIVYTGAISFPLEDGEYAINEVSLKANKEYTSSNATMIRIIEHDAVAGGQNFNIRIYKYDQDDPVTPLAGAYFRITSYNIYTDEEDGERKLEFVENTTNPIEGKSDENGEFVYIGKHDVVYKVEEIDAPEGYAVSNEVEYFCFTGYRPADEFLGIMDENGNEINPYINLIDTESEFRFTIANRQANTALKLLKVNGEKELLEGAEFELYKVDNNGEDSITVDGKEIKAVKSTDKLVTDEKGELPISYLEKGEYYLVETVAPEKHLLVEKPIHFTYDGDTTYKFDDNDAIISYVEAEAPDIYNILTVEDEKSDNVDYRIRKVWDDYSDTGGKRPDSIKVSFSKIYEGEIETLDTFELTREDQWSRVFKDMPTAIDGKLAKYYGDEENIPWYLKVVDSTNPEETVITNVSRPWFPELPYSGGDYGKFTIKKTVTGSASSSKSYDFKVTMKFADGRSYEETKSVKPGGELLYDYIEKGTEITVEELNTSGYTVTYSLDGKNVNKVNFKMAASGDNTIVVNNHSGVNTGDISSTGFYIILILIAFIFTGVMAALKNGREK